MTSGSPDEHGRAQRLAENERLIREANWEVEREALDREEAARVALDEELELSCACGADDCHEHVLLTVRAYRDAHRLPHRFVVAHGHVNERIERVVERHDGYDVVEKLPQYQA